MAAPLRAAAAEVGLSRPPLALGVIGSERREGNQSCVVGRGKGRMGGEVRGGQGICVGLVCVWGVGVGKV